MIGQLKNIENLKKICYNNVIPHFILICGNKYSGRKTLSKEFSNMIGGNVVNIDTTIDSIRNMIDMCYTDKDKTIYTIFDIENASVIALNGLLKICEEPPKNSYIIATVENIDTLLDTIKSRATIFYIDSYTREELYSYTKGCDNEELLINYCTTIGEIEYWKQHNIKDFISFIDQLDVKKLKIPIILTQIHKKVDFGKDKSDLVDYHFFIKFLICKYYDTYKWKDDLQFNAFVDLNYKTYRQMAFKGIRKDSLLDMYIIKLKNVFR